jgi:hypothetical protein
MIDKDHGILPDASAGGPPFDTNNPGMRRDCQRSLPCQGSRRSVPSWTSKVKVLM